MFLKTEDSTQKPGNFEQSSVCELFKAFQRLQPTEQKIFLGKIPRHTVWNALVNPDGAEDFYSKDSLLDSIQFDIPIVFLDLEATGLSTQEDRIVEIGMVKFEPEGNLSQRVLRINPGKVPISPGAFELHRISIEDLVGEPQFDEVSNEIFSFLEGCYICGYNILKFDIPLLEAEFKRIGKTFPLSDHKYIDQYVLWQNNERRNLAGAMQQFCGKLHTNAHEALSDVHACIQLFNAQSERYLWHSLEEVARICNEFITSDSRECHRCGQKGHIAKCCPSFASDNRECHRCSQKGHLATNCPSITENRECHHCGQKGHLATNCVSVTNNNECYRCSQKGHLAINCPSMTDNRECYRCGQKGHLASNCASRTDNRECYRCGQKGHLAANCPSITDNWEKGHVATNCPSKPDGSECYCCNQKGHFATNCPSRTISRECHSCGQKGHLAKDCPFKQTIAERFSQGWVYQQQQQHGYRGQPRPRQNHTSQGAPNP